MPAIDNTVNNTHWVATSNLTKVEAAVQKLQRKAQRHNLPEPSVIVTDHTRIDKVDVYEDGELVKKDFPVQKTMIEVSGVFPRFSDYQFLAKIDHVTSQESNIVLTPGQQFEKELLESGTDFHTCGSGCDHCGVERQRNETFIVKNVKTDKMVQVGSTCVDDYVGTKTLPQLMAAFDINAIMYDVEYFDDMNNEFARGAFHSAVEARLFLALAIEDTDNAGFRPSKFDYPTWRHVNNCLYDKRDIDYSGDEVGVARAHLEGSAHPSLEKADKVLDWLMSIDTTTQKSMFVKNAQAILATGNFSPTDEGGRWAAMVAAIPNSYNREMAIIRDKQKSLNEPFGEQKKRGRLKLTVRNIKESDDGAMYASTRVSLVDDEGRKFAWKASGYGVDIKIGNTYLMTGTIKSHSEFKDIHYTHLSRCGDFEKVADDAPVPNFADKIKPTPKPKISLDEASISQRIVPEDFEHQIILHRTWKESKGSFEVNTFLTITADSIVDDLKKQLIDDVAEQGSVHLLAKLKKEDDEAIQDVLKLATDKIATLNHPEFITAQISEDIDLQPFSVTHKKENLSIADIFIPVKLIDSDHVGIIQEQDIKPEHKITQFEQSTSKSLVVTEMEMAKLKEHYYPMTRFLEKVKSSGFERVVINYGYEQTVMIPAQTTRERGLPNGVEVRYRDLPVAPEISAQIKGRKMVAFTADSEVDINKAGIAMLTEHIQGDNQGYVLMPEFMPYAPNFNDSLKSIATALTRESENGLETVTVLGVYPDMLLPLREAGVEIRHIHVSTGETSPFLSSLPSQADMTITASKDTPVDSVIVSKIDDVRTMVATFPRKSPEVLMTKALAEKMVNACEPLMDMSCSPLKNWGGERVNRVTAELLADVAGSIEGKTPQEAAEALFSFSDEAKVYASAFMKEELGVDVALAPVISTPIKEAVKVELQQQNKFNF